MSFLNGLSAMGAATAQFAGTAGLEQQKNDLAQQSMVLADQLATTRESVGRQEAGQIAATAAEKEHTFQSGEGVLNRKSAETVAATHAGATLGAANINAASAKYTADLASKGLYAQIAAGEPTRQAAILAQNQQTALAAVTAANAKSLRDAHLALQEETGKPDADPTKITKLKSDVTTLEASATTEAATTQAAAMMYRTDQDSVQHFNTQLVAATAALNQMGMGDTDRVAQKALVESLQKQLAGANRALAYSSDLVHGRIGAATGTAPPGVAPPVPAGVPAGARYSTSLKIWQAPDGSLYDAAGKPTTAPGTAAPTGLMGRP